MKKNIVFIGPPGAGKGTQAYILAERMGVPNVSMGDLCRAEAKTGSELGKRISSFIDFGNLVPDDIGALVFERELVKDKYQKGFILDGFPRTLGQAKILSDVLQKINMELDIAIVLDVPEELIVDRIVHRMTCGNCGMMYHDKFRPTKVDGVCDGCGGKNFVKRKDDTPEIVKGRIDVYNNQTLPVIDFYKEQGLLEIVDGVGDIEDVASRIKEIVGY